MYNVLQKTSRPSQIVLWQSWQACHCRSYLPDARGSECVSTTALPLLVIVVLSSALVFCRFSWLAGLAMTVLTAKKIETNVGFIVDRRLEHNQYFNGRREI